MGILFGTDGIRGVANRELDAALAFRVGQAAAIVMSEDKNGKPTVCIGKDTRISSDMLEAALAAGFYSSGADVAILGVMPTPAVAYMTTQLGMDAGVVISASHNPYEHNGIKIFNAMGFKLSDELENRIEALVLSEDPLPVRTGGEIGRKIGVQSGVGSYIDHLLASCDCEPGGLRVLADCSNGAASATAPLLFEGLKLDFECINCRPNGVNINGGCGSTHPEGLCEAVVKGGFDLGIAFDGDADRCIAVDELGRVVDGDSIMAICGADMKENGGLRGGAVVATVMSNMGFQKYMQRNGIGLLRADVGDRNVLELMQSSGCNLGGEQSGHIIFLDDATTGDGQLAAVKLLCVLGRSGKKLSELEARIPRYPQVLLGVGIEGGNDAKRRTMDDGRLKRAISEMEKGLDGRILVRPSGTEALIRVMVEAGDELVAREKAVFLSDVIKSITSL